MRTDKKIKRKKLSDNFETLPLVPLINKVVLPGEIRPITIEYESHLNILEQVAARDKRIFLVAQKKGHSPDDILAENLHKIGTIATVKDIIGGDEDLISLIIEPHSRGCIRRVIQAESISEASIEPLKTPDTDDPQELKAYLRRTNSVYQKLIKIKKNIAKLSPGFNPIKENLFRKNISFNLDDPQRFISQVVIIAELDYEKAQKILEELTLIGQLKLLNSYLKDELQVLEIEEKIERNTFAKLREDQRNAILRKKVEAIQDELEEIHRVPGLDDLKERIEQVDLPEEVLAIIKKELNKLKDAPPISPLTTVIINYIDCLLDLPWGIYTKDNPELKEAAKTLDSDHYGLEDVKERILEYLSVLKIKGGMSGQILCLVGPPGVGKTSLGHSIARSLNKQFVRASLGGIKDVAEITGHRMTYVGARPGKIIQSMTKAGSMNPVFLLDEIDKMGQDIHGDPASALLEVLDPIQNETFKDNYLETEFNLSEVLFITTANTLPGIPEPLKDRMEIIKIPGYTRHEKLRIAKDFLIVKSKEKHGLSNLRTTFSDNAVYEIIDNYTQEAGVRNLERKVDSIFRKFAREIIEAESTLDTFEPKMITKSNVSKYLGTTEFTSKELPSELLPGEAIGLAWTPYGGDIISIEVSLMKSPHKLLLTGQLGDVMQESAKAALSFIRSRADKLNISDKDFRRNLIHIHVPAGAVPKDGPSAGVTIAAALASAFTGKALPNDLAMTGEISLTGRILPVGGLEQKILAAKRHNIKTIIVPQKTMPKINSLKNEYLEGLEIKPFDYLDDVLEFLKLI